jgi:hypothetical protein
MGMGVPRFTLLVLALVMSVPATAEAGRPRFGVMMDVGVPSGAAGSVVYRPVGAVRLHAGGGHNLIGPGVEAGLAIAPLGGFLTPSLVLDAGRFFARDANPAVERIVGEHAATPERFGYDYASAHLGLELGGEWFTFYLRGGVSYVRADLSSADRDGDVTTMTDAEVRAVGVSARLGFIVYFAK